jgi:hypothetical protein
MKRKILSALLACFAPAFLKVSAAETLAGVESVSSVQPASIGDLEIFLKANHTSGRPFPDVGYSAFKRPFLSLNGFSKNEKGIIKGEAVSFIQQMVTLCYFAFTRQMDLQKNTPLCGLFGSSKTASRIEMQQHYFSTNHKYFLKFQEMLMQVLEWAKEYPAKKVEAARALSQPYGISAELGIVWVKDNNGIVPMPINPQKMSKMIYQAAAPYGWWGDYYQRSIMVIEGKLIESPGVYVESKDGRVFKFVQERGALGGFVTNPKTARTMEDYPVVSFLQSMSLFRVQEGIQKAFIHLPHSWEEQQEFEAVLLEELQKDLEAGDQDAGFAESFLGAYVRSLEWNTSKVEVIEEPLVDTLLVGKSSSVASLPDVLTQRIDSLYEQQVRVEYEARVRKQQEEISKKVAEGSVVGRPKPHKGGKGTSAPSKAPAKDSTPTSLDQDVFTAEQRAELIAKILNDVKERGRVKWRTLARMIITGLKSAAKGDHVIVDCTGRGSHFGLRLKGVEEGAGLTVVRPHGKADRTVSAGEAKSLAEKLIELTFKVMSVEQQTTPSK